MSPVNALTQVEQAQGQRYADLAKVINRLGLMSPRNFGTG
jgi:hypothetical protein